MTKKESDVTVSPKEVRQARAFLRKTDERLTTAIMPPKLFALTAKRTGKTFSELLKTIASLKMGGQGEGQSAQTESLIEGR